MKVIREGRIKRRMSVEPKWRFTCVHCESVLEAGTEDLKYSGVLGSGAIYKYTCPVCKCERLIEESRLNALRGDEDVYGS